MNTTATIPNMLTAANLLAVTFIKHGFFTRAGGISTGDFASLNTSYFTSDDEQNVIHNRNLVAEQLSSTNSKLITLKQVHSNQALIVNSSNLPNYKVEGDAIVTNIPNLILGVQTADCIPILLVDTKSSVIAAIHSGHAGAFNGVIENTVNKMLTLNASPSNIVAALGPSIKQISYEVDATFYQKYLASNPSNQQFFINSNNSNHYLFSLPHFVISKLQALGITNIDEIKLDTFSNHKQFFSHRFATKNNIQRGLQISTIMIKE